MPTRLSAALLDNTGPAPAISTQLPDRWAYVTFAEAAAAADT